MHRNGSSVGINGAGRDRIGVFRFDISNRTVFCRNIVDTITHVSPNIDRTRHRRINLGCGDCRNTVIRLYGVTHRKIDLLNHSIGLADDRIALNRNDFSINGQRFRRCRTD